MVVLMVGWALACETASECAEKALVAERAAAWAAYQRVLGRQWADEVRPLGPEAAQARRDACWAGDEASCVCETASSMGGKWRTRACAMGAEEQCARISGAERAKACASVDDPAHPVCDGWRVVGRYPIRWKKPVVSPQGVLDSATGAWTDADPDNPQFVQLFSWDAWPAHRAFGLLHGEFAASSAQSIVNARGKVVPWQEGLLVRGSEGLKATGGYVLAAEATFAPPNTVSPIAPKDVGVSLRLEERAAPAVAKLLDGGGRVVGSLPWPSDGVVSKVSGRVRWVRVEGSPLELLPVLSHDGGLTAAPGAVQLVPSDLPAGTKLRIHGEGNPLTISAAGLDQVAAPSMELVLADGSTLPHQSGQVVGPPTPPWTLVVHDCEGRPMEGVPFGLPELGISGASGEMALPLGLKGEPRVPLAWSGPFRTWRITYDRPWQRALAIAACEVRLPAATHKERRIASRLYPDKWPIEGEVVTWAQPGDTEAQGNHFGYRVLGPGTPWLVDSPPSPMLTSFEHKQKWMADLGDRLKGAYLIVPGPGKVPRVAAKQVRALSKDIPYHAIPYRPFTREDLAQWLPFPVEIVLADGERVGLSMSPCPLEGRVCHVEGPPDDPPETWPSHPSVEGRWSRVGILEPLGIEDGPNLLPLTPEERWALLAPLSPAERAAAWASEPWSPRARPKELPAEACAVPLPDGLIWWHGIVWEKEP